MIAFGRAALFEAIMTLFFIRSSFAFNVSFQEYEFFLKFTSFHVWMINAGQLHFSEVCQTCVETWH